MEHTNYNVTKLFKDNNYEYLTRPLGDYLFIAGTELYFFFNSFPHSLPL